MDVIKDFLNKHLIKQIGNTFNESCCTELIVDDPIAFLSVVLSNGYYVSSILWWEHSRLDMTPIIGGGGTLDPRNPNFYFFAETHIQRTFDSTTDLETYKCYLSSIQSQYPDIVLYPGFDIQQKRQGPVCVNPNEKLQ